MAVSFPAPKSRQVAVHGVSAFCTDLFITRDPEAQAKGFSFKANLCTRAILEAKTVAEATVRLLCIDLGETKADIAACEIGMSDKSFGDAIASSDLRAFGDRLAGSTKLIQDNLGEITKAVGLARGTPEGKPPEVPVVPSGPILRTAPPPGPAPPPPAYIAPPPTPPPAASPEDRIRAGMKESRLSPLEQKTFLDALTACLQSYTPRTAQVVDAVIPAAGAVERRMRGMGELDKLDELCHQIRDAAALGGPETGESLRGLAECLVCKDRGLTLMVALTEQLKAAAA